MIPGHSTRATRALQKLAEEDPAFAALALWCRHIDSDLRDLPAWTDGQAIHYGAPFEALTLPEQMGLAAHHILHIAFRHAPRARAMFVRLGDRYDEDLFNLATDSIVNETLMLAGYILPRPIVRLTRLLQEAAGEKLHPEDAIGAWDAERLYVHLLKDADAPTRPSDRGEGPRGSAGTGAGQGSTGKARPRPGGARAEAARAYADRQGFRPDIQSDGQDQQDGAGTEDDADWRQRLARAFEAGRLAGRGIGALGHRIADLPQVRTPWEVLLRGLVTRAVMHDPRPLAARPARRWIARDADARQTGSPAPAFEPAWQRDRDIPRIVVGVDSSGSVDSTLLAMFAAQVAGIARRTGAETHVLVFDTTVRSRAVMGGGQWDRRITDILFSRDGGTSFVAVLDEAVALKPSAVVILTDLVGPFGPPPPKGLPVIWAVPGEPPASGAPFGRVLSLAR